MTFDDAFYEQLSAISSDLQKASARIDTINRNDDGILFVNPDDTETLEAIALFQDAQRRLSALLATVPD